MPSVIKSHLTRCRDVQPTSGSPHGCGGLGDAELLRRVRSGDLEAYGELHARHAEAAHELARRLGVGAPDLLVGEAFAQVLTALEHGEGPDLAFRPHLLGVVARLHRARGGRRPERVDRIVPEGHARLSLATAAYASLPEPWQVLLWHLDVQDEPLTRVAPLLGLSERSAAALAPRARDGLRRGYLQAHLAQQRPDHTSCAWAHAVLEDYLHGTGSEEEAALVETHLAVCRTCAALAVEVLEVDAERGRVVAAAVLGTSAPAYLGIADTGAASDTASLPGRGVRVGGGHRVRSPTSATGALGLAAAVLTVGALVNATVVLSPTDEPPPSAERPVLREQVPTSDPGLPLPPYEVVPPGVRTIRAVEAASSLELGVPVAPGTVFTLAAPAVVTASPGPAGPTAAAPPPPPPDDPFTGTSGEPAPFQPSADRPSFAAAPLVSMSEERALGPVTVRVELEVDRVVEQPVLALAAAAPPADRVPPVRLRVSAH